MVHAFRMHVEEIVRGKRPIKLHEESERKPINLERYLRRLVLVKARKQLYRKQKEEKKSSTKKTDVSTDKIGANNQSVSFSSILVKDKHACYCANHLLQE